jgi:hypothetical protein
MSVIGAAEWYTSHVKNLNDHHLKKVLVREVKSRLRARFFNAECLKACIGDIYRIDETGKEVA